MVVAASLELIFKMGRKFPSMKNFKQRLPHRFKRLCRILPLLVSIQVSAQKSEPFNNPCEIRTALLTCSPGSDLYSVFGHSALRLTNASAGTDLVFNFGTFDFNEPGFYLKFLKGNLSYYLSVSDYSEFLESYRAEGRTVYEQKLALSCGVNKVLKQILDSNALDQNKYYRYNFIKDNCTTRLRDLLLNKDQIYTRVFIAPGITTRSLIHRYLDSAGRQWTKLGIDILLGQNADDEIDTWHAMFLPDLLMRGVDSSFSFENAPLIDSKAVVVNTTKAKKNTHRSYPVIIISFLSILLMFIYSRKGVFEEVKRLLDLLLLSATGLVGILLLLLWFGTDHEITRNNFNLLWALPTNLFAAVFSKYAKLYGWFTLFAALSSGILLLTWKWIPQEINPALAPLIILLFFRYAVIGKRAVIRNSKVTVDKPQ